MGCKEYGQGVVFAPMGEHRRRRIKINRLQDISERKRMMVITNDLKKGTKIRLACGWDAEVYDNKKGNIRLAKVYGFETEIGSVYAHDIKLARVEGRWVPVVGIRKLGG